MEERERRKISGKAMLATFSVCLVLLFLGRIIFSVFGITLDAFRVGVGTIHVSCLMSHVWRLRVQLHHRMSSRPRTGEEVKNCFCLRIPLSL